MLRRASPFTVGFTDRIASMSVTTTLTSLLSRNTSRPGVIGTALQIATVFAAAMSIVRERERGTLEQLLVSPMSRWGLMLGKIVPYLCVSMTMAMILFVILRWVFFVPIHGSLTMLVVAGIFIVPCHWTSIWGDREFTGWVAPIAITTQ